jgi:hypothetical protein
VVCGNISHNNRGTQLPWNKAKVIGAVRDLTECLASRRCVFLGACLQAVVSMSLQPSYTTLRQAIRGRVVSFSTTGFLSSAALQNLPWPRNRIQLLNISSKAPKVRICILQDCFVLSLRFTSCP